MRGDRPRALSHALVAGRVWCICSAYAWCIRGVTRNMCVKCHAREGTLPNLAVVPLSPRKTSARTARRTRHSHSTGRDSARGDGGLARMHARTRSQDGGVRTGHTGTTDGHTDTRTGHVARSLLGQLLSSHGDLSLSDRHSGHDPPRLRARRRSARHRYLQGCKVQHVGQ